MTTNDFPPIPQTGIDPLALPEDQEARLLAKRRKADQTDPFASDPDDEIRRIGRLALRRDMPHPYDYLALGDHCARLSLVERDRRLLVFYVGKTLYAFRRASELAGPDSPDRALAQAAVEAYVEWLIQFTRVEPSRRNIAATLWAVAEAEQQFGSIEDLRDEAHLLALWYVSPPQDKDLTPQPDRTPLPVREAATQVPSDEVGTHHDEGTDLESVMLSVERPVEIVGVSETRSDRSDVFQIELEATMHGARAALPPVTFLPGTPRRKEGDDFDYGDRIDGRYEVAQVLKGGMGIVYLCYDHEERRSVALKTFLSHLLNNEAAVARFTKEAKTWIDLDKHRHIVQARRVQKFEGRPHIILEHITGPEGMGPDLRSWIRHNRIDLPTALEFGLHIVLGMRHATQQIAGLVHRDLKPANILVRHDGIAKVTDFGLVRSFDLDDPQPVIEEEISPSASSSLTRVGAIIGTPPYLAPEQCRADALDMRSDIYSFGCVLYEMLTRKTLFDAKLVSEWVYAHLNHTPVFPDSAALIPPAVRELALACLEKNPANRPESWDKLADTLAGLYEGVTGRPPEMESNGPALEVRELMDKGYSLTELGYADESLTVYNRVLELEPKSAWAWARKGRTLRLLGRYDEALTSYDRALELNPRFAWAWTGKGQVLERLNQIERALAAHETATELQPGNVWAWYNKAEVLHSQRDFDGSMRVLDRALELDPHHAESWAKRGQVLRALERYPEALNAYNRALELHPPYAWAWNGKGLALKAMGRLQEALEAFEQAARHQPGEVWHWYNQSEMLVEMGQYQQALGPTQQATRVAPTHAYSWAKLAQVYRYLQRYEDAVGAYDRALALKPDYAWAVNGQGIVLERLGRYDAALEMYRRASEIAPDDVWHWYNQGNLLVLQERYPEAVPLLERAIHINPDHARSWARLGNTYRQMEQPEKALQCLARAVRLTPDYAWAWNERGAAFETLGRYDDAVESYHRAAEAEPGNPLYWYNKGDMLMFVKRHEEALEALQRALEADPRYVRAWAKQGQALRRMRRFEEALASYSRAVELATDYAWAWNGRGLALSALGRHEEALACFRRAATLQSDDVWFWYNQADELIVMHRYEEALLPLERALRLNRSHAESWAKRGQALRRLNRFKESVAAYDQALKIEPHYAWAWNGRGLALEAMGRREEALVSYERASEEDPSSAWYWINQIEPLLALNRHQDALDVIDEALKAMPGNEFGLGAQGADPAPAGSPRGSAGRLRARAQPLARIRLGVERQRAGVCGARSL